MEHPFQANAVRFHNIEFSPEGIALLSQNSKLLFVAKKEIRQITLKYGFQSERPIVEMTFGILILGLGVYLILNIILKALIYRVMHVEELLGLLLLPIGGWFFVDGFRKRLYFEVKLDNDKRKFPLGKNPDKNELQKFIRYASQLGYVIDASFLEQIN
jgi:hypothetical protein